MRTETTIGEAARITGVKVPTIRYYERIGLLPRPSRTESNRRAFDQEDLRRLAFIRHARELGFEIGAIRALLLLRDRRDQPCRNADAIAQARLEEIEARIAGLVTLKADLEAMIESGPHGRVGECHVIEVLADHALCRSDHSSHARLSPLDEQLDKRREGGS
ncbi:MerR family transcriptional regulator [Pleomorphomonas carboxyditropha]|uniref:MerR family transcriptional regulator n=1 Tax=Pleomorphomonas carboxyditropha TaxID=2023338 RepID=A0A2G9WSC5_9HYPH|nr:helix-turn-helix domain-containing protein [Pleomorphomonas carboxyditropha]PIO97040.1 MerR family transcriptional regulator [Pleomorphomonas carboxyditropha]